MLFFLNVLWTVTYISLQRGPLFSKAQSGSFIQARQPTATVIEGTDFTFEWDFRLQSIDRPKLSKLVFGIWSNGYIGSYFVTVKNDSKGIENPEMAQKHPDYVGRVKWVGDVAKSYAAFRVTNVRITDANTYGCEINLGFFDDTLDSKITLTVTQKRLSNSSSFIQVPPSRMNAMTGHMKEFKWIYRIIAADKKLSTTLHWGTYKSSNFRALYSVESNGAITKDPEYTNRITGNTKTDQSSTTSYSFNLFNITVLDEGKYAFKVVLGNSKTLEHQVLLEVHELPKITTPPSVNGPIDEGGALVLFCKATGKPSPEFKWIKDGRTIKTERGKAESVYYVNHLTKSDAGFYSCFVSNHVGNVSSHKIHVRVKYGPSMIFPLETKTVLSWKGHPSRLECSADADPVAQYLWRRADGKMMNPQIEGPANFSVLIVKPSTDLDFTNYTCVAKNKIGEDNAIFILKPIGPPNPPVIIYVEVSRNAIKSTWIKPSSKQDTPITGYILKVMERGRHREKWREIAFKAKSNYFILRHLTKATRYRIKLFATNVVGHSNASKERQVETLWEGPPDSPILHLNDTIIKSSQFLVSWDVPDNDGGGTFNLFTVWYRVVDVNRTKGTWRTINVTDTTCLLKLNWSSNYEIMVTAWNKHGQSFTDPDNAARVTVLEEKAVIADGNDDNDEEVESGVVPDSRKTAKKGYPPYLPYLSLLLLVVVLIVVVCVWRSKIRKRHPREAIVKYTVKHENDEEELENAPDPRIRDWEFPRTDLAIERVIGDGAFGVVSKAYALDLRDKKGWTMVAVKSLRESATEIEKRDLLSELSLLKKLKPHPHIIKLLGCITTSDSPMVIIEYVPYGDLLGYLRRSRGINDSYYDNPDIKPDTNLTSQQMIRFAWQIADGMRYISSKKIIHRDLAARNVLVGENQRCKITDFGMARDVNSSTIYVPRSEGRIPVKWTAVEAMTGEMNYSTKSDVWSFGIVLFEICTIGAEPYPGIAPWRIPDVVQTGIRNPKPAYVKDELYAIMTKCWETEPQDRPTFEWLCNAIRGMEIRGNQNYVNVKDCLEAHGNNMVESIA